LTADGSQITSSKEWSSHREYLKAMLAHYQYGHMPPRPKTLDIKQTRSLDVFDGKAVQIELTITISRGDKSVDLHVALVRPKQAGKFPVVIKNAPNLLEGPKTKRNKKSYADEQAGIADVIARGYVVCKFRRTDLAADALGKRSEGVFPLYPEYDWGAIAVWAWGYQIVIDALKTMEFADTARIVATGHSRGGKAALCAAVYDERIAIAAPNSSGTGGTGSLKYFETGQRPQLIAAHVGKFDHWWNKRFLKFASNEKKLPFDAHFAKALIAPRGLVNPHALQDYWANPYGTQLTHQAAKIVFDWLGAGDRIGVHWRPGGHAQGIEDWRALLDFADVLFFKKKVTRKFDILPYKDAKPPINWKAPPNK
jgi:dienelactone hydrolase